MLWNEENLPTDAGIAIGVHFVTRVKEGSGLKCHLSFKEALENGTCEYGGPHWFFFFFFFLRFGSIRVKNTNKVTTSRKANEVVRDHDGGNVECYDSVFYSQKTSNNEVRCDFVVD